MKAVLSALALLAASSAPPERIERTVFLMGTEATVTVEASSRAAAVAASENAIRALAAAEERLSTWRSDSELARLNGLPAGERLELSPELAADLRAAEACRRETGGAFDPTVGVLVRAWGLRDGGREPSGDEIAEALDATGPDGLAWVADTVVAKRPGVLVEEGGFGKGAGLADALAVLAADPQVARGAIDLGGQVAMSGPGTAWMLTLADPSDRRRAVVQVTVEGGSVATSGNSERGIRVAGRRASHLLDPRSGRPANDFGSLTVWDRRDGTQTPLWADCLSTGLYVQGPDAALAWAADRPGVDALVLEKVGRSVRIRATPGFQGRLRPLIPEVSIEISGPKDSESSAGSRAQKVNGGGGSLAS